MICRCGKKAEQKRRQVSAGAAEIRAVPLALALLSLLSAMIAPATLPAQTSDAGVESSHAENTNPSAAPATDFGSLLFMFSGWLQSEPAVEDVQEEAAPESAETGDLDPEKFSLQLVLTPAVISLYDPARQLAAGRQDLSSEFSTALDLSPVYSNERATAQALPFEGRLTEKSHELDAGKPAVDAASVSLDSGGLATPADSPETPLAPAAGQNILPWPSAERIDVGPVLENDARNDGGATLALTTEPAGREATEAISKESNRPAVPETELSRALNLQNKNYAEDRSRESETRDRGQAPVSGRAQIDLPREAEKFALPASSEDGPLAARAEGSISQGEKSGFSSARDVFPGVEPHAQWISQGTFFRALESERPPAPPAANVWSSTVDRLAAEISNHVRHNRHEVTMRLEPPELGNLRIELLLDGDRLQARVTAEIADAGQLIQRHLPELRQALQAHKLDLVDVQVDLGGWAGLDAGLAQDYRQQPQERADLAALSTTPQASDGEAMETSKTPSVSNGAVSVWA
jgi:flagellar hook-length control protein FliK